MARASLELGTWGQIWVTKRAPSAGGKRTVYRARALYRDFDGISREVEAEGRTKSAAQTRLLKKLRERVQARYVASLKPTDRFSVAAELWLAHVTEMVADGRRSPGTRDTYRQKLDNHVLPAIAGVRLGEITTPLVDSVVGSIKNRVGPPTARTSRTVISGVLGLAVRHGAIPTNPVRDVDTIASKPKRRPRALDEDERRAWFAMLAANPKAVEADLPDLTTFLLATGARIGEALGLLWAEVNLGAGEIEISHQVTRSRGEGLLRVRTKSAAGERVLKLPSWCLEMLMRRWEQGVRLEEPVFCDAIGRFRDPANVRRDLRRARAPVSSEARQELGVALMRARRAARRSRQEVAEALTWPRTRVELVETGRVRLDVDDVIQLADLYRITGGERAQLLVVAAEAGQRSDGDALAWITSHSFRKTTATILDDAGQSARQIADQLGHARPSLTQDVYMGRRAKNPAAAEALEQAMGGHPMEPKPGSLPGESRDRPEGQTR